MILIIIWYDRYEMTLATRILPRYNWKAMEGIMLMVNEDGVGSGLALKALPTVKLNV